MARACNRRAVFNLSTACTLCSAADVFSLSRALYMDSDSFFVMRGHMLAVEAWLHVLEDTARMSALLGNMYVVPGPEVRAG